MHSPRIRATYCLTLNTVSASAFVRPLPCTHLRHASSSPAASTSPTPTRKAITLTTDTGRIPWSHLTTREKAIRGTQQSFNFSIIIVGALLTGGVGYILYTEVFSPSSKTAVFNATVSRIRSDSRCLDILVGDSYSDRGEDGTEGEPRKSEWTWGRTWPFATSRGKQIAAFGEGSWSRWARNRIVASNTETDRMGTEHMRMHFYVSGPKAEGTVWVHMTRRKSESQWEYERLVLDMGAEKIVLEERTKESGMKGGKIFGVRWW